MNRVDHLQQELAGPAHQLLLSDVEIQNEHEIRNVLDAIGRLCINRSQIEGQCPGSDGLAFCGWAVARVQVAQRYEDPPRTESGGRRSSSVLDRHGCGMGARVFRSVCVSSLRALLANFTVSRGHYRMHFLLLAKLLRAPRYYVTETAMVLCVLASLLIPEAVFATS
jgi:hypothetical protein